MQAALELIAEKGFHGCPMAEIAERAKVAAGTIYHYFEGKDALINTLHRELEKRILAVIQQGYPAEASIRERFLYLCKSLLRYFTAHPLHFRFLEQYYNSPYGISLRRERLLGKAEEKALLLELFEEGTEKKVIKDLPKTILASLAFGPLFFLIREHIFGFLILNEELIRQSAEACWDAVQIR